MTEHGFLVYPIVTRAAGGTPVVVKEKDRVTDVDADARAAISDRTRLVYLANPNNPTGTMIGGNALARLADGLPSGALLVLDGAYAEFAEGYDGGLSLIGEPRQHLHDPDFFQALRAWRAAHRLGLWPARGDRRAEPHPRPVQPVRAADGGRHRRAGRPRPRRPLPGRERADAGLAGQGAGRGRGAVGHLLRQFPAGPVRQRRDAQACDDHLQAQGLIVRRVDAYGLANCLRITIGDEASCRRVAHAVAEFMGSRR